MKFSEDFKLLVIISSKKLHPDDILEGIDQCLVPVTPLPVALSGARVQIASDYHRFAILTSLEQGLLQPFYLVTWVV